MTTDYVTRWDMRRFLELMREPSMADVNAGAGSQLNMTGVAKGSAEGTQPSATSVNRDTIPVATMHEYTAFAVRVDPATKMVKSRSTKDTRSYSCNAQNFEQAYKEASNHVALYEGETLAIVRSGK